MMEVTLSDKYIISLENSQVTIDQVGGKGASLARLVASGLPVPEGFNITTAAYREFVDHNRLQPSIQAAVASIDVSQPRSLESAAQEIQQIFSKAEIPPEVANVIVEAYASLPGTNPAVAVRSSATAEDLPEASFAGQQETYLNVSGAGDVLEATKRCWASLWTARAIGYRARQDISPDTVALAVVVQLLVNAEAAGILFTANPVTGARNQSLISAAWGLGEAVVGGAVTPDSYTVDKKRLQVIEQHISDKQVMTVRTNGGTQEKAVPENLRQVPVLSEKAALELTQLGLQIEEIYERPMDIEWAVADGEFAIVQARPITALPEPGVEPPTDWPMPDPKGQYMRASIIDFLPDPLSPLFATMGVSELNKGLQRLVDRLIGHPEALPDDTIITLNGYAYMSVKYTPKQWWVLLTRLVPAFPRMLRTQVKYWQEVELPAYRQTVERWREKQPFELSPNELLQGADEIFKAVTDHLTTLQASTLGAAGGAETLFTQVYNRLVKRPDDPPAPTFLLGFDCTPIRAEKELYDLAQWILESESLQQYLLVTSIDDIIKDFESKQCPPEVGAGSWQDWQARFQDYLQDYGYSIYDLDFAKPLPMHDPTPILGTLKMYLGGKGRNPYERQQAQEQRRQAVLQEVRQRIGGIKRWAFKKTLGWSQDLVPLREDSIAEIGMGYPVLKNLLEELGRRLVERRALEAPEDIYWLEEDEVRQAADRLEHNQEPRRMTEEVQARKDLWQARKQATPPPQLPPKAKYLGMDWEQFLAGGSGGDDGDLIHGVGASPGQVTAPARVLHGPQDFDEMRPGDVLVASITTPAWTPLFAMASAIVTDIGGPLSHGSIVAREYGIPAVLGTGVSTRRIQNGQLITVDGGAGTVALTPEDSSE
ncbi:MAG: PEP/pyruvate-binding domain-containing protein [Anaerolineales bacterium]|jgi:phosphohistidine swiveling domain-containing protein